MPFSNNNLTSRNNLKNGLIYLCIALIFTYFGYLIGTANKPMPSQPAMTDASYTVSQSSVIKSLQAIAVGTIIANNGNTVTIESDNKTQATFPLAANYQMVKTASSSAGKNAVQPDTTIKLNQKALFNLSLQNGNYVITSFSYVPTK